MLITLYFVCPMTITKLLHQHFTYIIKHFVIVKVCLEI
jgi:hypothetical protein